MNRAPVLEEQRDDIPLLLGHGLGWLHSSQFWLLSITDVPKAKAWLLGLQVAGRVLSVRAYQREDDKAKLSENISIAFTWKGLEILRRHEDPDFPFPTAFRSGMASQLRAKLLRDEARSRWRWGDVSDGPEERHVVHVLVAHCWDSAAAQPVPLLHPPSDAFQIMRVLGNPGAFRGGKLYEPFGFRDGVSQPSIYGLRAEQVDAPAPSARYARDHVIAPGEFIVGYRNEYDQLGYVPDLVGWPGAHGGLGAGKRFALNGSFLAVRQIEQDVDAFAKLKNVVPKGQDANPPRNLAEKALGRCLKEDARPLCKAGEPGQLSDTQANDFRYRVDDQDGRRCPHGAHIRRMNPRDSLGHDVESGLASSKLHRLLRRGRPYIEPPEGDPSDSKGKQGLFFIACNTDLERQFEFLFQRWLGNPRFAGKQDEVDPILGQGTWPKSFASPGEPCGGKYDMHQYTTTLGGGYFFLPGLAALTFLLS